MALVYVHGVANRKDGDERGAELRDGLLRTLMIPKVFPTDTEIIAPYWGKYGGNPRWGLASANNAGLERLGPDDESVTGLIAAGGNPDRVLLDLAGTSMPDAVDALYSITDDPPADFAAQAVRYCREQTALRPRGTEAQRYPWLAEVHDDRAFLDRLVDEVTDEQPSRLEILGGPRSVRDRFAAGVLRLGRVANAMVSEPVNDLLRRRAGRAFAMCFGDIAAYLAQRGTPAEPGPIVEVVADAIERASVPGERVVVLAHSMGGNIVHDLLGHFRPDLTVDVLVTIGSQVGLFEELKLFGASDPDVSGAEGGRAATPPNVRHWLNVVDRADPLAFRAAPVFDRVGDYAYPSGAAWAHAAYLRQPNFHDRIGRRIAEVLA